MSKKQSNQKLNRKLQSTPIAIVGMSALFPDSGDLQQYWENILSEADCIKDVPADRWNVDDYYDPNKGTPDKTYSKVGGFIPDTDFNPIEWGLPPNILEITDVSQLLSLVMAKRVLADGGYGEDARDFDPSMTGCILGVGGGQKLMNPLLSRLQYPVWEKVLASVGIAESDREVVIEKMQKAYIRWEEMSFPGTLGNVVTGRIANRLNLGGTNCVVDAACASSLAGIRMAISDLLEYRSDMMITGGVDTDNSIFMYMCFSKTPAFTTGDKSRPFDQDSSGILIGEGIGMLLLKRLEDAERDGDKIYATIKGVGSSSDGRFKSIYAPRAEGQVLALERAYEAAGVDPSTVGLWEAHGTGTKAGDATEFKALRAFMGEGKKTTALGSVKSQIGHTKNSAGVAGLIKGALSLHHKVLPATINITAPNPEMNLDGSPVYLNSTTRPWIRPVGAPPRRAGVSAFGFGGTNFHYVLEEHDQPKPGSRIQSAPASLVISASTREGLIKSLTEQRTALSGESSAEAFWSWSESSKTLKIPAKHARAGFIAKDAQEAVGRLTSLLDGLNKNLGEQAFSLPEGIYYRAEAAQGKVAALFAGQGSPYLDMGKDLLWNFPPVEKAFAQQDELFATQEEPLSQIVYPIGVYTNEDKKAQAAKLQQTQNAQPAIGALSQGLYQVLCDAGFSADMTAGHSFGELTALWAAGVISGEDFAFLAKARGESMKPQPGVDAGGMLAVMGKISGIEGLIKEFKDLKAANYNSNKQVVLAGPKDQLEAAAVKLKAQKFSTVMLGVSAAFHTPMVGHAQKPFAEAIKKVKFGAPKVPVYSNETAKAHLKTPARIQKALEAHMLQSVRFTQQIEQMHKDGARIFVEFGPQSILTKLVGNILHGEEHVALAVNPSAKQGGDVQLRLAYTELKVLGVELSGLDPWASAKKPVTKKMKPGSVKLGGSNYISDQTRKAYQEALNDGFQISQAKAPEPVIKTVIVKEPAEPQIIHAPAPVSSVGSEVHEALGKSLADFQAHQAETLKVHEQFLANQSEYSKAFFQALSSPAASQLGPQIDGFSKHQSETLRVHENYLNHQTQFATQVFDTIKEQMGHLGGSAPLSIPAATPVARPNLQAMVQSVAAPVSSPAAPAIAAPVAQPVVAAPVVTPEPVFEEVPAEAIFVGAVEATLLQVVAEKTGYQVEMLDLSMDLESDLGVDSIKRVEILYAVQESLPELGQVKPETLSELRTLEEISNQLEGATSGTKAPAVQASAPAKPAGSHQSEDVMFGLMSVISSKTGYDHSMLDPEMDLESDLGVDSIKRVEILYAIQERLPGLGELKPDELSELRTLREIGDYLTGFTGTAVAAPVSAAAQPVAAPVANSGSSDSEISQALLEVVAEKTGYQSEMLDLSMDLESDLGVDSIKRVEILYAIQERLPNLGELKPDELSELRTLKEISDHILSSTSGSRSAAPAAAQPVAAPVASSGSSDSEISQALLEVVAEKTGYQSEMLDLSMDLESDLGVDSIKRVEILYAIQERLPNLGELKPDELSELRTLKEISDHILSSTAGSRSAAPAPAAAQPVSAPVASSGSSDSEISQALLEVVAEKTGYQSEMLDLSMDLESDLGVDSIKRVEILYAIQERLPNLGELKPDELSELRTLKEISDHILGSTAGSRAAAPVQEATASFVAPVVSSAPAGGDVSKALLDVVAEKTGYQSEMLDLSMDLESDLGVDSIKRVEILYAIQERLPDLGELNPDELSELRTLQEICDHIGGVSSNAAPAPSATTSAPVAPSGAGGAELSQALLEVVAEKTGYQAEMLDLSMDLESDLGVDSIKRVEILYAIQERIPSLGELNPDALSELRTLQEISDHIGGASSTPAPVAATALAASAGQPMSEVLSQALLEVVAEKTGYQTEMLDLSMSLEADLGIDSIKRVEILYGLTEKLPALGEMNPDELSSLQGLQEILDHLGSKKKSLASETPSASAKSAFPAASAVGRLPVSLERLSPADRLDVSFAPGHQLVLVGDPKLAGSVLPQLQEAGLTDCSFLSLPGLKAPKGLTGPVLTEISEQSLSDALDQLRAKQPIGGLLYLHPQGTGKQWFDPKEAQAVKACFFLAKFLKNDLAQAASSGRSLFVTLTRTDGQLGCSASGSFGVLGGGLSGLVKTLKTEWPQVFCRMIDVAPEVEVGPAVQAELFDANNVLSETGYSTAGRMTLVAKDQRFNGTLKPISSKEVFLVSGGAKGVTAACVKGVAEVSKASFILFGRSKQTPEPAWATGKASAPELQQAAMVHLQGIGEKPTPIILRKMVSGVLGSREITETLAQIEGTGAKAIYLAGDVTDPENIQQALSANPFGPITGLIHGAGVLADKWIEKKSFADYEAVVGTKVGGIQALLEAVDPKKLNYLVLFSSAAGFFGNQGQSDYSLANEVLNKISQRFSHLYPKAKSLSVNWGPWEGGMVNDSLKKLFESRGVQVIPVEAGVQTLVQEMSCATGPCEMVVGSSMVTPEPLGPELKSYQIETNVDEESLSDFVDHRLGKLKVMPMAYSLNWMARATLGLYPGLQLVSMDQAKVLKGIMVTGSKSYRLEIKEQSKQADQVVCELKLVALGTKLPMVHYSALVTLGIASPKPLSVPLPQTTGSSAGHFYTDGTLFHGPSFQGVKELISQDKGRLVLKLQVEEPQSLAGYEPAVINPMAEDQSLQAMLIQARHLSGNASLPLAIESYQSYRTLPYGVPVYLDLQVTRFEPGKLIAEVGLCDDQGVLYSKMSGAEVTISEKLNKKFTV